MQRTSKRYETIVSNIKAKNNDIMERTLDISGCKATIIYIKQITDRAALSEYVIKPLAQYSGEHGLRASQLKNIVYADECMRDTDVNKVEQYVLDGMTVILLSSDTEYAVINMRKVDKRAIPEPDTMYTLRGPKDSFIENLDTNLSLIRYRLKNSNLRVDMLEVGERTKTAVAVLYFEDIANDTCVNEVKKRISNISIDGMASSGELESFLLNKKMSIFPQTGITERSDMACGALLEGKVIIIADGSPWVLIAPKVFSEFLWACDDFYQNKFFSTMMRLLRVISLILTFMVSSLYVGIVSYHNDVLPADYMIAIAQARSRVPFNALLEVLLIEIIVELIRESLVRVPSKIGTAIGIVGAIIIGQAAVAAGIFSPLLLIVVSLSLMSSFVPADFTLVDAFRVLKFFLILATGFFGFFGFTLVILLLLAKLVSINTFGVPYMAPAAPFNSKDFGKSIFYSKSMAPTRPAYLRTKDNTRTNVNKKGK